MARPRGTGSIYQRSDGKWVAAIRVNGKKIARYAKTEKEAKAQLRELLTSPPEPKAEPAQPSPTLSEWCEAWLRQMAHERRPSTIATYRQVFTILTDKLGHVPLHDLTPEQFTLTFTQLREEQRGPRQLNLAHTFLKASLNDAVTMRKIPENPLNHVRKPQWEPQERYYWNIEELNRFITTAMEAESKWASFFVFIAVTGLRMSEALGLRVSDVDVERRQAQIRQALVWTKHGFVMVGPKTKHARRVISLPQLAIEALSHWSMDGELIFTKDDGTAPVPQTIRPILISLCKRAGVPVLNIHGLRHVHAMLVLQTTRDPYIAQKRLGHSNVTVTMGIYGYSPDDDSGVADKLDELLRE